MSKSRKIKLAIRACVVIVIASILLAGPAAILSARRSGNPDHYVVTVVMFWINTAIFTALGLWLWRRSESVIDWDKDLEERMTYTITYEEWEQRNLIKIKN